MDHKSVGSLTEPRKTLPMDEQMHPSPLLEYLDHIMSGSQEPMSHGGLYNMLRKVKRTARANPPFFERVEVPHNQYELQSYWKRVFGEVLDIVNLRKILDGGADPQQVAYPNPTKDCAWDCDFKNVCPLFDNGSAAEDALTELYEKHDPHDHYYAYHERETTERAGA